MKIVVIGGSGLIGSKLVKLLSEDAANEVISTSQASGVNTLTGEGLDEALAGAHTVVDVTNSPSFEDKAVLKFFETSGHNIIAAELKANVRHHVALSVVGIDRLPENGYFRAKVAQEKLIRESQIPYTILRSTQFFEFLKGIAQTGTVGQTIYLSPALVQPIASDDVAAALADLTVRPPLNGIVEVGGPQRFSLAELVKRYLGETGDPRNVIVDVNARYYGAVLNDQSLNPGPNPRLGSQTFEEWLARSMAKV